MHLKPSDLHAQYSSAYWWLMVPVGSEHWEWACLARRHCCLLMSTQAWGGVLAPSYAPGGRRQAETMAQIFRNKQLF